MLMLIPKPYTVAKAEASRQRQASRTGLQLAAGKSPTKAKCVVWLARGTHLRQGGQLAEVGQELGSGWCYILIHRSVMASGSEPLRRNNPLITQPVGQTEK